MADVIEVEFEARRCSFCGRRPATLLCDMPVRARYAGHPPRSLGEPWEQSEIRTCDRELCRECALELAQGVHCCPECLKWLHAAEIRKAHGRQGGPLRGR